MDLEVADSVILITGGSDGLGFGLASRLLREGALVAICGRDAQRLEKATEALSAIPTDREALLAVQADVSVPADIDRFVKSAVERWGKVNGVVNNAGGHNAGPFDEVDDAQWHGDLELKLFGAIRMIRATLPHLRSAGGGAIINVLNNMAQAPKPRSTPTSVSRAAGLALTKALSKELGPDNIRVNAVMMGTVWTGQYERRAQEEGRSMEDQKKVLVEQFGVPLGRIGRAEEFGDLVAFLVSPRASYISGAAINLDGGTSPVA